MHSTALPGCRTDGDTGAVSCGWRKKSKVRRTQDNWRVGTYDRIKYLNSNSLAELCLDTLPIAGSGVCMHSKTFGGSGRCLQWVRWSLQSHCTTRAASTLTWAILPSQEMEFTTRTLWFIIPKSLALLDEFWQVWNFGGGGFACEQFRTQNVMFCLAMKAKHGVI